MEGLEIVPIPTQLLTYSNYQPCAHHLATYYSYYYHNIATYCLIQTIGQRDELEITHIPLHV